MSTALSANAVETAPTHNSAAPTTAPFGSSEVAPSTGATTATMGAEPTPLAPSAFAAQPAHDSVAPISTQNAGVANGHAATSPISAGASEPAVAVPTATELKEHEAKNKDFKKIEKVVKKEEKKDSKQLKSVEKETKANIKAEAKAAKELSKIQKKADKAKLKEAKYKKGLVEAQTRHNAAVTKLSKLTEQLSIKRADHEKLVAARDSKKQTLQHVKSVKEENDATRQAVLRSATPVLGSS